MPLTLTNANAGDKIMLNSETKSILVVDHQLNFEKLLLDISTHFINMPAESIDDAIEDAQRRICECLDIKMGTDLIT